MDYIKNQVNKAVQGVTKQLVAPPKESTFLENGQLTANEFLQAADKLTNVCGSWKWFKAVEPKYETQYLPKEKQFIGIQNLCSKLRVKDQIKQTNMEIIEGENGEEIIIAKAVQPVGENVQQVDEPEELRFYNLYIIYDLYYFTPRLYLGGTDEKQVPLTYDQIKEAIYKKKIQIMQDIASEYADKTVTYEYHPYLNTYLATIHPCRHADTLKNLTQMMMDNGLEKQKIHADNSILIFLKFMSSVIPTIPFDFVADISFA